MNILRKINIPFLSIILSICIVFLSIGYSAINSITSEIEGKLLASKQTGIFITDASYFSDLYADKDNSDVKNFIKTTINTMVSLSNTEGNSALTFAVTVYNSSNEDYIFMGTNYANEFYDNLNIVFELTDINVGDTLKSGEYITFYLTFSYMDDVVSDNNVLNSYINFNFSKVITGYGDLEIKHETTKVWADGNYQFYRALFKVTNIGTAVVDNWSITLPFDDVSLNSGWGNNVDISLNETNNTIVVKSNAPLAVGSDTEFTIQFGVKDDNYEFDEFIVVIDGEMGEPNEPSLAPNPDSPEIEEPDNPSINPEPEEPEVEEPDNPIVGPEIDVEGNYVYILENLNVTLIISNGWSDNVSYFTHFDVIVTNTLDVSVSNWEFKIDASNGETIDQAWNIVTNEENGEIKVSNSMNGNMLAPGGSYTEGGIIIKSQNSNYVPILK